MWMPITHASWTAERLRSLARARFGDESIVVVANRQPFRHERSADGSVIVHRSTGGLVAALEPVVQACGGVWVAHGAGDADRAVVDSRGRVQSSEANGYRLRRVWLERRETQGYYDGFANEGLWPLCHRVHVQPVFRSHDFAMYRLVNQRFADAVIDELGTDAPIVLVQDYHLALLPRLIKSRSRRSTIVTFWHVPFPGPRDFAICPWGQVLLEGLLGSTIVGFQTPNDCRNFVDTVDSQVPGVIHDGETIIHAAGRTLVRAYPASIEWPNHWARHSPPVDVCRQTIRECLQLAPDARLALGVDRLDYTKGIGEKFLAVERLLETHPELRDRFAFVQIAEPSRACLPAYQEASSRIRTVASRVNSRFGRAGGGPIILLERRHEPADLIRYFRAADACYVGSLHDGMNLVAKEFVGARDDERGALVLSQFAGAARELTAALLTNPYAIDDCADTLARALSMPAAEQAWRMRRLRAVVAASNTYAWAGRMLGDAALLRSDDCGCIHEPDGTSLGRLHA